MKSIELQLAEYFEAQDELYPAITPEEIVGSPVRLSTPIRPSGGIWWAAVAAAVVVLVVGAVAMLATTRRGDEPAVQPSSTTIAVEESNIESASTTLVEAPESVATTVPVQVTSIEELEVPVVVSETITPTSGFGDVTWTRYSAARFAVPRDAILFEPGVGYVGYAQFQQVDPSGGNRVYEWRSDDAVSWERRALPTFDGYEHVSIGSGWKSRDSALGLWARAGSDESSDWFIESGDTWIPVTFDDSSRPAVEGVEFKILWGEPISSGDATLFATTGFTGIPWERYFGDGSPEFLAVEWDEATRQVIVKDENSNTRYVELVVSVNGSKVTFTDTASGEIVHEVTATDGFAVEMILESIVPTRVGELWIANDDGVLQWVPNPTPGNHFDWGIPIVALPTGGFVIHDELEEDQTTFWTSQDGASWTEVGTTTFPVQGQGGTRITSWPGGLRAFVESETAATYVMDSVDAVTWHEVSGPTPLGETFDTSFGYINTALGPVDGELLVSASRDGVTWERIGVPPDLALPRIDGSSVSGVAGDMFYQVVVEGSGEIHYWIGRFE